MKIWLEVALVVFVWAYLFGCAIELTAKWLARIVWEEWERCVKRAEAAAAE